MDVLADVAEQPDKRNHIRAAINKAPDCQRLRREMPVYEGFRQQGIGQRASWFKLTGLSQRAKRYVGPYHRPDHREDGVMLVAIEPVHPQRALSTKACKRFLVLDLASIFRKFVCHAVRRIIRPSHTAI